jgi:uncharacterized membrane protein
VSAVIRSITTRPTLVISFAAGLGAGLLLVGLPWQERILAGWCLSATIFVVWVTRQLGAMSPERLKKRAADLDEGAVTILCLSMLVAAASFAGVVLELLAIHGQVGGSVLPMTLMGATIVCSWFFIHTVFAVHYAQVFYNAPPGGKSSLNFGGDDEEPDYWDFVYFAVAIGASTATSDTNLRSRAMRRIVTAHAIFSFFFNATVLALAINIAAGLLGSN